MDFTTLGNLCRGFSGPSSINALEAYHWRLTKGSIPATALGNVAIHMFQKDQASLSYGEIEKLLTKFHPVTYRGYGRDCSTKSRPCEYSKKEPKRK
jgi:hypothetical protein